MERHPTRRLSVGRRLVLPAAVGLGVGVGDGIVGMVPVVDKYPAIHSMYRVLIAATGTLGLALDWDAGLTDSLLAGSLALLGSRLPVVVQTGQLQQFGMVRPAVARPRVAPLNARPPHMRVVDGVGG